MSCIVYPTYQFIHTLAPALKSSKRRIPIAFPIAIGERRRRNRINSILKERMATRGRDCDFISGFHTKLLYGCTTGGGAAPAARNRLGEWLAARGRNDKNYFA